MKRTLIILLTLALIFSLTACNASKKGNELSIGATPVPHATLLSLVKDDLAALGINLKIVEFTDYVQPNMAVISGDLDANFFQHVPYLESNEEWSAKLASAFGVHIEPFGLYSLKYNNVTELPNGSSIAIPNDPSNGGRALLLLQANGLITLRSDATLLATPRDIVSNPKNFRFIEMEAAQLPRALFDVDAATINGNYALEAGFNPLNNSLIIEDAQSPYVNIVVVQKGKEDDERILALKNALLSEKVRNFIHNTYNGGVAPIF